MGQEMVGRASVVRGSHAPWALSLFLIHVAFWTVYGAISNPWPVHPDMLEAYLWGHEFQFGYFKHPPLWAWIAGAWFEVFPRSNWAFYLLCSLNSGLAFLGVWRLYGVYAPADARRAGVLLLLFATPFYTFLSLNFNANTILLSIWPWTAYVFARSIERSDLRYAALFGACAAAGVLSKYYSVVLLLSCLIASAVHPNAKRYYRSFAPYLSVLVACLLIAPHAVWLVNNGFPTLEYAEFKTAFSDKKTYESILTFFLGCLAFHTVVIGLVWLGRRRAEPSGRILEQTRVPFLSVLAFGPFLITILVGLLGHVRLSTNFATAVFILAPLMLMEAMRPNLSSLNFLAGRLRIFVYAAALPLALVAPAFMVAQGKPISTMPYLEAAQEAARQWSEATPAPLRTVAGTLPYSAVAAFYGEGEIKEFTNFNTRHAPWINAERLAETGLLIICGAWDTACRTSAAAYLALEGRAVDVTLARRLGNSEGPAQSFAIYVIPPWKDNSLAGKAPPLSSRSSAYAARHGVAAQD